jgi:hypothetical protein
MPCLVHKGRFTSGIACRRGLEEIMVDSEREDKDKKKGF